MRRRSPRPAPQCVPLADVEAGVNYVPVITTPAGLVRYATGDVVRFVSTEPPRLQFVGRQRCCSIPPVKRVTERDVLETLLAVCTRNGWHAIAFHVAPYEQRLGPGQVLNVHEWWLELGTHTMKTPTANVLGPELDAELSRRSPRLRDPARDGPDRGAARAARHARRVRKLGERAEENRQREQAAPLPLRPAHRRPARRARAPSTRPRSRRSRRPIWRRSAGSAVFGESHFVSTGGACLQALERLTVSVRPNRLQAGSSDLRRTCLSSAGRRLRRTSRPRPMQASSLHRFPWNAIGLGLQTRPGRWKLRAAQSRAAGSTPIMNNSQPVIIPAPPPSSPSLSSSRTRPWR
ncbi:MAG: GH3 auxin-responsive promoter family protein [Lacunisphaera sp.]